MSNEIYGLNSSKLLPTHLRTDPIRAESRLRIKVRLRDGHAGTTCAGKEFYRTQADDAGYIEQVVYVTDMKAIHAKLEDRMERVAMASELYYETLRRHVSGALPQRREQVSKLPDDLNEWPEWARSIEARCDLSIERSHQGIAHRGIRPFVEVLVVEKLGPPQSSEQQHEEKMATRRLDEMGELARVVAAATASAVTAAMAPLLARLESKK